MWQTILTAVLVLLTAGYAGLILYYRRLFTRLKTVSPAKGNPATRFSIIIPARNEEESIGTCLSSLFSQDYPAHLFEVIVIDDHSTDGTAGMVSRLQHTYPNLKLIRLSEALDGKLLNAYKKKAIETAIPQTSGEWILTTDADCEAGPGWLRAYDAYIREHQPALVAGPVKFSNCGTLVSVFQCLDFLSLQGVTAAAVSAQRHSMCNGANLAYRKDAFMEVEGFRGIDKVASGDDMLLMHKIKKRFPGRLGYLFSPEAIVSTAPMPDWISFFNQRIRWASKAEKYDDKSIIAVLVLVYFYNLSLLGVGIAGIFDSYLLLLFAISLVVKTATELLFMYPVAAFYGEKKLVWWFPFMQPLHIVYMVVAGWLGKFGSYRWKGRKVK